MAPNLTDAAKRALWKRMAEAPFTKGQLERCALAAGQSSVRSYAAITAFMNDLKSKGAMYYTGAGKSGVWTLLPREQWAGEPIPQQTPKPEIKAPADDGPYDPAPEIEGPHNGLTTAFAEHLWHDLGGGDASMALRSCPIMEQRAWREAAERALAFMFQMGFVGPAGQPRPRPYGWSYRWLYEANTWEIADEEGGYIAMVNEDADIPMLLAAPDMEAAIGHVLERFGEKGGLRRSDLQVLADALPSESPFRPRQPDTPPTPPSASDA